MVEIFYLANVFRVQATDISVNRQVILKTNLTEIFLNSIEKWISHSKKKVQYFC